MLITNYLLEIILRIKNHVFFKKGQHNYFGCLNSTDVILFSRKINQWLRPTYHRELSFFYHINHSLMFERGNLT